MTSIMLAFHWASIGTNKNYACTKFPEAIIPAVAVTAFPAHAD